MPHQDITKAQSTQRFLHLKLSKESELRNIILLAAEACQVPAAFLAFSEKGQCKLHGSTGKLAEQLKNEYSFCELFKRQKRMVLIPDLRHSKKLSAHPLVTGTPNLRFLAGIPLITHDKHYVGCLYVLDTEPRTLSKRRRNMLRILANQVITTLEFDLSLNVLKQQFLEAKNAENKLRYFFESSDSSYLLIDRSMEVMAFNKAMFKGFYKRFGKSIKPGAKISEFVLPSFLTDFVANVERTWLGETVQHERHITSSNGAIRWARIAYNPAYDGDGNIIGTSFHVTDITDRKNSEQKIVNQNEALRQIAHFQSHELRKPLASILGLINLIKMEGLDTNLQNLLMMERAALQLDDVIKGMAGQIDIHTDDNKLQ